jgi:hypothetical protein
MGRAGDTGEGVIDPLASAFFRTKKSLDRFDELKAKADAARTRARVAEQRYRDEWFAELGRRAAEANLSWCTYCGKVGSPKAMKSAFSAYWKTDHYDPAPHFREITWHRACRSCQPRLTLEAQLEAYLAERGHPMFPDRDYRDQQPSPTTVKMLLKRIQMPPHPDVLRNA